MTVRSAGYRPRRPSRRRAPAIAAGLAVVLVVLLAAAGLGLLPTTGPAASPTTAAVVPSGTPAEDPGPPATSPTTAPQPTASPTESLEPVAIVPVTHFRAAPAGTSPDEVLAVLDGTSDRYEALELVESEADAILVALGAGRPADAARLQLAPDAAALATDLAETRNRLAFLRADEVTAAVRALAWGEAALFGVDRVASLAEWPLRAQLPARAAEQPAYDPAAAWTLFAGGDMLFDRGVYKTVEIDGRGVDFPFDGGTAEITSRCKDCSPLGWDLPRTRRTGNAGAVRALIEGADIAIANFENPAPNRFRFHTSGTVFSADPSMIDGVVNAGIDYVSLANNHIGDAGRQGILETIENLDERGVRHSGAGENTSAAHTPAVLEAGGTKVAILGYDTIARVYNAGEDRVGSARLTQKACRQDVRQARDDGADVVIVFPHWGTEYDPTPFDRQRELADACVDAGADMVIGNHAHWAGALEVRDGRPIWYALGNFVFDQTWSEPTMEGITLELTFLGADLRQIRMRPHIILDRAQPNFLSTGGDGRVVMGQVFDASKGLLDW